MKKNKKKFWKFIGKGLIFVLKIPYYFIMGAIRIIQKSSRILEKDKIKRKRKSIASKYVPFKIIESIEGNYKFWFDKILKSKSQIGIIIGARGSGKTALGIKLLENIYHRTNKKCFAMGFKPEEFPFWIEVISDISKIRDNSWVLIDEGGILFSSRNSMSSANKILSKLIIISRHKNLNIIFISQNSSNLEINILRQVDFLILKKSSLLQKEFERKIVQKIYSESQKKFEEHNKEKGLAYIYSGNFKGFISNPLPSFWKKSISKSFK